MAKKFKQKTEYTASYGRFRGVDRGGGISKISNNRLSYTENMYRDYDGENAEAIESIPGYRHLYGFGQRINGIYSLKQADNDDSILVHSGTELYRFRISDMILLENLEPLGQLKDVRSRGFAVKDGFFILDGDGIHKVDQSGAFKAVEPDDADVYIPTTYVDGAEFEQRNLLTDRFFEEYTVTDPYEVCYGTPALRYTVIDKDNMICAVTGIDESFQGAVFVPKYTTLSGSVYSVKEISEAAFDSNKKITSVRLCEGVEKIGKNAFRYCTALTKVITPSTIKEIGGSAFANCTSLVEFFLGRDTESLGGDMLLGCSSLKEIHYGGNANDIMLIYNYLILEGKNINFNSEDTSIRIEIPVFDDAEEIDKVTLDGEEVSHQILTDTENGISVLLSFDGEWSISGRRVKISGTLKQRSSDFSGRSSSFLDTAGGKEIGGFSAITGCTVAESFDGRIFFSGNPELPNTVFYTERDRTGENNPLYFGAMNYFNDGTGNYPVISLLSVRDAIAVFKSGDDGSGSIFYHSPYETGDAVVPKVYPVSYIHSGICAKGASISFFDDPVFLSPLGLSALEHKSINLERSIGVRSHNVNYDLLKEDLSEVTLCEWLGYLVVGVNGKMYLADSRSTFIHPTQNTEYEWFVIKDIGTYTSDRRAYTYASIAPPGLSVHKNADGRCTATVYTRMDGTQIHFYAPENGVNYSVNPSDEWIGGDISPAIYFHSHGQLLFFGTGTGDVCVFNNDMRGVPPDRIRISTGFDMDEYTRDMGRKLHPDFYSFINHAPRYAITTCLDNCEIPHLTKETVKHSLAVKFKSYGSANIHLEVGTDRKGYSEIMSFSGGELDFTNINFESVTFDKSDFYTLPFAEKEKGWIEKEITIYSDSFRSPICIHSLSYRYRIKGRIEQR